MKKKHEGCIYCGGSQYHQEEPELMAKDMTLRDYFAAKAVEGYCTGGNCDSIAQIVQCAYEIADAMLKERKK